MKILNFSFVFKSTTALVLIYWSVALLSLVLLIHIFTSKENVVEDKVRLPPHILPKYTFTK